MASVCTVVKKFQEKFSNDLKFKFSNNRPTLGQDGVGNIVFYMCYVCQDRSTLLEFLRECNLIKTELKCLKCNGAMKLAAKKNISDGFIWVCRNSRDGKVCGAQKSIRYGSWFGCSKLNLEEILLLTFQMVKGERTGRIAEEFFFASHTLADWRQFINETILDFAMLTSEKLGGQGKIVEVDESKFGECKFRMKHAVEEQWVFGGVERESGKLFLVAINDISPETLLNVIEKWIEKGTTIYSDSWRAYDRLGCMGYDHLTVNHSVTFVDPETGYPPNITESAKKHVKSTLPTFNRQRDFHFFLAVNLFYKSCQEKNVDVFNTFLEIIREIRWENSNISV